MRTVWIGLFSSLLLTFGLFVVLWSGLTPLSLYFALWADGDAVGGAMWNVFVVSFCLLLYIGVQAGGALFYPAEDKVARALDIAFSVLPLFTVGAALVARWHFGMPLNTFQVFVVILAVMATAIDLLLITGFFLLTNKLPAGEPAVVIQGARK